MSLSLNKKIAISSLMILVMSFTSITVFLQNGGDENSHAGTDHGKASILSHGSGDEDLANNSHKDSRYVKIDKALRAHVKDKKATVLVTDTDGEVMYVTSDFYNIFNIDKNTDFIGKNLFDCIYSEDISDFTKKYAKAIKEDGTGLGPIRVDLGGEERFIMLTSFKYEVDGEIEKVIFSIHDMTKKFEKFKNRTGNTNKELAFLDAIYTGIVKK